MKHQHNVQIAINWHQDDDTKELSKMSDACRSDYLVSLRVKHHTTRWVWFVVLVIVLVICATIKTM